MAERNAKRSAFFRGEAGMRQTEKEIENAKERSEQRRAQANQPFRFRINPGKSTQIIICDDKPDFFMHEHALKDNDGKYGRVFCGCVKSFDNCPVCEAQAKSNEKGRSAESYWALMLTCIDLTPFRTKNGEEVEFSRKLLVVKQSQQKKFIRLYQKEGTLRGALLTMTRDGEKDSAIGNDIEFEEFVSEKEMKSYHRSWKDRDGKQHEENCGDPLVYEEIFEEPTTEGLRALVGGDDAPGSRRQQEREVGSRRRGGDEDRSDSPRRSRSKKDDDWEEENDDAPFDPDPPRETGRRVRGRDEGKTETRAGRRPAREEAEEPAEEAAPRRRTREEPEDSKPARGARTRREEPEDEPEEEAPRRRSTAVPETRRAAKVEEPEDEAEDEQDDPPPRRPATREAGPSRSGPAPRRGREPEPEDEPEEDAPPPRRRAVPAEEEAPSRAATRRARR